MITPTVGRIVWYYPDKNWKEDGMPRAAVVAAVAKVRINADEYYSLNLTICDTNGETFAMVGVRLIQEGDPTPMAGCFCEWMPYQKGQAAKTEELMKAMTPPTLQPVDTADLSKRIVEKPWAKITPDDVNNAILGAHYYVFPGTTLTVCCIKLVNGFTVTGESAAAHPGNFDVKIGQELSFADAKRKIWPLLGYSLRERLYRVEKD